MKIPIMFIIGDNMGGDTICGQSIYYGKGALRISQMCNAGPDEIAHPEYGKCQRINMEDVKQLVINKEYKKLFSMYQAQHWIAWFDLDYGGNPEGIFTAACPPEALHALENGIIQHLLKELFEQILNTKSGGMLDNLCSNWYNYPGQHCMRSYHIDGFPQLLFTNGISTLSNLKADDKVGIMFCVIIVGLQEDGS